jgi:hypothetical protein
VKEMQIDFMQPHLVLGESVEPRFLSTPVKIIAPILEQFRIQATSVPYSQAGPGAWSGNACGRGVREDRQYPPPVRSA